MLELTLLTDEQIFGENQLEILNIYGTKAAMTDFSILLGGYVSDGFYTSEEKALKDRTGWWWTKTKYNADALVVAKTGTIYCYDVNKRDGGARPAFSYSLISKNSSNGVRGFNGILVIEFGEYPQTIVDEVLSDELEYAWCFGTITKTGKTYTTDSINYRNPNNFQAYPHKEYEYKGNKYIRFIGDSNGEGAVLSDGRIIKRDKVYWIKVEPIKWLVDEKTDIALSKKIIFAGIQFKSTCDYDGDFKQTDIYKFMNTYFLKEIAEPNKLTEHEESETWEDLVSEANRRLSLLKK